MNTQATRKREPLRPLQVVGIILVVGALAGSALLLSVPETLTPVDGAIPWVENSLLRSVVQVLSLGYSLPASSPGAIKTLVVGLASGLSLIVLGVAILGRSRGGMDDGPVADGQAVASSDGGEGEAKPDQPDTRKHIAPLIASQVLLGLYLVWSFASCRWSAAPELALGGSMLLTTYYLWSFGVGNSLSPRAATYAAIGMVAVFGLTSAIAIWYYYGRNPVLDAKFPFGNPRFLAACLLPGILTCLTVGGDQLVCAVRGRGNWLMVALLAVAMVLMMVAFWLTNSRGPSIGLAIGVLAVVFFSLRGVARVVPVMVAVLGLVVVGTFLYQMKDVTSPTGRDATLRFRLYAWDYAFSMFSDRPYRGWGQGGFVLHGDAHAANDVIADPLPFTARIAHAHNEWLEVLADLGTVGFVLVVGGLLLTLRAGMKALKVPLPSTHRWALIGLMGALVALIVEECFGVGLRVSGVPAAFYATVGLIWALSAHGTVGMATQLSRSKLGRFSTGPIGVVLGVLVLVVAMNDFAAARATYEVSAALDRGEPELAIEHATAARSPLNPQRALTREILTARAHMLAAVKLQIQADDRAQRSIATDPPNRKLIGLAAEDYHKSDEQCLLASAALKRLVSRSPDFIGHGLLNYQINTVRAHNAGAAASLLQWLDLSPETRATLASTQAAVDSFLNDAMLSLQREMQRQPFDQRLAIYAISLLDERVPPNAQFELLARPLRYHRISSDYLYALGELARDPRLPATLHALEAAAKASIAAPGGDAADEQAGKLAWAPEVLRLVAACHFLLGDHEASLRAIEAAVPAYEALAGRSPYGAAAFYSELADRRFFADPVTPASALAASARAIELAPWSREGRELRDGVISRQIAYHLAGGDEQAGMALLRSIAPDDVSEAGLTRALAQRYFRLCESVAQRLRPGEANAFPEQTMAALARWMDRSLELEPANSMSLHLAANIAFQRGDDEATVAYLKRAMEQGLGPDDVLRFILAALSVRSESDLLRAMWAELSPEVDVDTILAPQQTEEPADAALPPAPSPESDALPAADTTGESSAGSTGEPDTP